MAKIARIRQEIERLKGICTAQIKANPGQTFPFVMEMTGYDKLLSFLDTLAVEDADKLRYCIEYINPRFPRLYNGNLNIRHLRVPDEHWAEMAITLILSFGGKIYALYRGNLKDGKLADWPTPMIVDEGDRYTDEWLNDLLDCGHNCQ